ncbi:MAG: Rrf2 family transcriptional regulator [bacterium]|nr:Rrf2 family transcriptional regulator [bacterium]
MNISTRGRYAIRALIEIAEKGEKSVLTVKKICESQDISTTYLEHLMVKLKKSGIIGSHRGTKGGFFLKMKPEEITLFDIITSVEGPVFLSKCLKTSDKIDCKFSKDCYLRGIYSRLSRAVEDIFKQVTLEQILGEKNGRG